jgi:hypothetical protein
VVVVEGVEPAAEVLMTFTTETALPAVEVAFVCGDIYIYIYR